MNKVGDLQAVLKQFPWARIEKDGTFRSRLLLASRGLLGTGKEFGYWCVTLYLFILTKVSFIG